MLSLQKLFTIATLAHVALMTVVPTETHAAQSASALPLVYVLS